MQTPKQSRRQAGFTLVELMVVVVILGALIALVGPNIWNMLFRSNVSVAETQMSNISTAIDLYRLDNKKLPGSLEELTESGDRNPEPYIERIPPDPWGNQYEYRDLGSNKFQLRSNGEDGISDTDDDIVWPKEEK